MASTLKFHRRHSRLTLLEILVVVGIICVLAGLLYSVLDGALGSSRAAACQNNLRQIGILLQTWGLDHPHRSPAGEVSPLYPRAVDAGGKTWVDQLDGGTAGGVFDCPERNSAGASGHGYGINPLAGATWNYSLGMLGDGYLLTPLEKKACLRTHIVNPAATVLLCDSAAIDPAGKAAPCREWRENPAAPWRPYVAFSLSGKPNSFGPCAPALGYDWGNAVAASGVGAMGWDSLVRAWGRHNGAAVCGMADGSVQRIELEKLTAPGWGEVGCMFDNEAAR